MKFPLVTRKRLQAALDKLRTQQDRVAAQLKEMKTAKAAASQALVEIQLVRDRATEAEKEASADADLCKTQLQQLKSVRDGELEWLYKVEQIAETRAAELNTLRRQIIEARQSHSRLLTELAARVKSHPPSARSATGYAANGRIPIVIGIDIEPDLREVNLQDPSWRATAQFFERLPKFRSRLQDLSGQRDTPLTWFVRADPQVEISNGSAAWAFDHFADHWRKLTDAGDEVGIHMHPWRWDGDRGAWLQDHDDDQWMQHCVDTVISAYQSFFGQPPTSYRGGDRFLNETVLRRIEAAGVLVDLSVENMPGTEQLAGHENAKGRIPDGTMTPPQAYWPSDSDFRTPGPLRPSGLGIMPLTSYPAGSLVLWMPPQDFNKALEIVLHDGRPISHLAFVIRADLSTSDLWHNFCSNADSLAGLVRDGRFEFVPATRAWTRVRTSLGWQPDASQA